MKPLLLLVLNTFILSLFLYSKLLPYKSNLDNKYKGVFNFFDNIFTPILNFLKKNIKPFQIGNHLHIDLSDFILFLFLILILNATI
jgi:uncharacterized protein YggT (Ycf19 family)